MAILKLLFGICRGEFSVNVPGSAFLNPWFSLSEGKGKAELCPCTEPCSHRRAAGQHLWSSSWEPRPGTHKPLPRQRCSCVCGAPEPILYRSWNQSLFCGYGEVKKWFPSWEPQSVMYVFLLSPPNIFRGLEKTHIIQWI